MVIFPRSTEDVSAIVKVTAEYGVPIVGRGAGTGLSGGAIPRAGGVTIGFARMNNILEIDLENERMVVQPGVVNLDISLAVQGMGYFYAPTPPANARAPSAATYRKTPVAPTLWPTALRPTTFWASSLFFRTARFI